MLDENFAFLVDEFGRPQQAKPMAFEAIEACRGKLPDNLLEFWHECGVGMWENGKFQFCNPLDYHSIVKLTLDGDRQFAPQRSHIFGFTAFGEIWMWNEDGVTLSINLPLLWASSPATEADWQPMPPAQALLSSLAGLDQPTQGDFREDAASSPWLFNRARKKLGDLAPGEVYGFVPVLELGGTATLAALERLPALEHLAILAQLGRATLFDYSTGDQRAVRTLGS